LVKEQIDLTGRADAGMTGALDSVVQEVAGIITSTLDINQVYEKFALEVKKLADFDRIYINVVDQVTGTYSVMYIFGLTDPARHDSRPRSPEGTQTQEVVNTGRPLIRQDIAADPRFIDDEQNLNTGLRSSIALPLVSKGKVIGTLGLRSCRVGAYGRNELMVLERLANLIAPAVENAELYQRLQATTQEIALVDEVARIITSTLDIDQVYEKFALEMKKLVDFDRVSVHVVDQEEGTYTLRYLVGPARSGRPVGIVSPLEGTQNQWVLTTGETLRRDDITNDLRFPSDREQLSLGMRANIAVPMVSKGRAIGVLALRSRRVGAFGSREQVILERLARQIAPAIENAELYRQRKEAEEAERLQTQQMEALYSIASLLVQPRSFEEKCNNVLEVLAQTAQADAAVLRAVDEKDTSLHLVAAVNPANVEPPPSPIIRCGEGRPG
jgi:GAF domain-containing protein